MALKEPSKETSMSRSSKMHDLKLAEQLQIHKKVNVLADLAFQGIQKGESVWLLPHKKPMKQKLSKIKEAQNKQLSRHRVRIEHAFAHLKTLRIIKDRNRNHKFNFRDLIIDIACRMHNFRLTRKNIHC